MEPTVIECVMWFVLTVSVFIGLGFLAVKVGEAEEAHRNGRF